MRVIVIEFSRNGTVLFRGECPIIADEQASYGLLDDLNRMTSYANQAGRRLTLRVETRPDPTSVVTGTLDSDGAAVMKDNVITGNSDGIAVADAPQLRQYDPSKYELVEKGAEKQQATKPKVAKKKALNGGKKPATKKGPAKKKAKR